MSGEQGTLAPGYYKVVFKKTVARNGDVRFIEGDLVELTQYDGLKTIFPRDDLILLEDAEHHQVDRS